MYMYCANSECVIDDLLRKVQLLSFKSKTSAAAILSDVKKIELQNGTATYTLLVFFP